MVDYNSKWNQNVESETKTGATTSQSCQRAYIAYAVCLMLFIVVVCLSFPFLLRELWLKLLNCELVLDMAKRAVSVGKWAGNTCLQYVVEDVSKVMLENVGLFLHIEFNVSQKLRAAKHLILIVYFIHGEIYFCLKKASFYCRELGNKLFRKWNLRINIESVTIDIVFWFSKDLSITKLICQLMFTCTLHSDTVLYSEFMDTICTHRYLYLGSVDICVPEHSFQMSCAREHLRISFLLDFHELHMELHKLLPLFQCIICLSTEGCF